MESESTLSARRRAEQPFRRDDHGTSIQYQADRNTGCDHPTPEISFET